jgi:hypothetical protein
MLNRPSFPSIHNFLPISVLRFRPISASPHPSHPTPARRVAAPSRRTCNGGSTAVRSCRRAQRRGPGRNGRGLRGGSRVPGPSARRIAGLAEGRDQRHVGEGGGAALDTDGAAVNQERTVGVPADGDGVVQVVAEDGQGARAGREGGGDRRGDALGQPLQARRGAAGAGGPDGTSSSASAATRTVP